MPVFDSCENNYCEEIAIGYTDDGDALCEECLFRWSLHADDLDLDPEFDEAEDFVDPECAHQLYSEPDLDERFTSGHPVRGESHGS